MQLVQFSLHNKLNVNEIQVILDGNNFHWHETNFVFLSNMGTLSAIKKKSVEHPNEAPLLLAY